MRPTARFDLPPLTEPSTALYVGHTNFPEAVWGDGGASNGEGEEVGPGVGYHRQAVVVEPVGVGALWDGREVEVLQVMAAVGQGPEGLGAGGELLTAVGEGGEVWTVHTGQPQQSRVWSGVSEVRRH